MTMVGAMPTMVEKHNTVEHWSFSTLTPIAAVGVATERSLRSTESRVLSFFSCSALANLLTAAKLRSWLACARSIRDLAPLDGRRTRNDTS